MQYSKANILLSWHNKSIWTVPVCLCAGSWLYEVMMLNQLRIQNFKLCSGFRRSMQTQHTHTHPPNPQSDQSNIWTVKCISPFTVSASELATVSLSSWKMIHHWDNQYFSCNTEQDSSDETQKVDLWYDSLCMRRGCYLTFRRSKWSVCLQGFLCPCGM